jgi:hypothetical protein
MDALTPLLPSLAVIVGAIGAGLAGVVGVWFAYLTNKAKMRADFQMMKDNAKLATQAAEQLGKTNEERAQKALQLQARWNQMAGISLPTDKDLNEANVPTVVPVPLPGEEKTCPDLPPKG